MVGFTKTFRVHITTRGEYEMFEQLRMAYGCKSLGSLCRYLLTVEAEAKGLVQDRLNEIKQWDLQRSAGHSPHATDKSDSREIPLSSMTIPRQCYSFDSLG